ncbi:MAG: sulfatase-like hydrolase/transferase [Phycisphaerae bacterium]|nr:sulfatase-like hydrolase/transferase [Phycisphaerae bacterium]
MAKPNILLLMSDEHRADVAGFAGDRVVRTPVLDELAASGVVFSNAYTPSPICVPARQCLMAGQLPRTCNCDGAWMDLAPGYPTFARRFAQYAYDTVCSGKLHHIGPDQMQGWTQRLAPDAEVFAKYCDGLIREEYLAYSQGLVTSKRTNADYVREAGAQFGPCQRFDLRAAEDADYYVRSRFVASKSRGAAPQRPLLLKLSLLQPHYPFLTSPELLDYYYSRVPIFNETPCDHPVLSQSQIEQPVQVAADEIRRAAAAYYGMVETVDGHYGRLLDALRAGGQNLDDWIIVYLSDHGEMLGQHGIWEKARFYEASVRVPLVIRYPRRFPAGRVVRENVNLCDLFATLCDLAGIAAPPGLDSRTLVPLMEGRAAGWSNETVSQIRRRGRHHVMIKQDSLKYQYYGEDIPEVLFDLGSDPGESRNASADPAYAPAMASFRRRLAALGYGPNADPHYANAGYAPGVPVAEARPGTLWEADSNPWQDPCK